jgi:hypothetical protein
MNYQQKLVDFMFAKAKVLKIGNAYPNYFTNDDAIEILNWSDEEAKYVYIKIRKELQKGIESDVYICPFCVLQLTIAHKQDMCAGCIYGKRHGICVQQWSDYNQFKKKYTSIVTWLRGTFNYNKYFMGE